jgi:uncharacterized protein (TIGR02996 family)
MGCCDGFLEAIWREPEEDSPRLIYADWLEEQGDVRGEFIRLQCELAALPADAAGRPALEARERQLLARHAAEWLGPLGDLLESWRFRRGFLDQVTMTPSDFMWHADLLFEQAPLQTVHFYRRNDVLRGEVAALADCPHLARLSTIVFNTDRGLRDDSVRLLADSPHLVGIRILDLSFNWIRNEGARALAQSPHLSRLERLCVSCNLIGRDGKQILRERFGQRVRF